MKTFKEFLFELSFDAKTMIIRIRGLANPINFHLMKLYMYPNSSHKEHWISELKTWFRDISIMEVKPRRRKLSKDTYFTLLYKEPLEDLSTHKKEIYLESITSQYHNEKTIVNISNFDEMREKIKRFHQDMCDMFAEDSYNNESLNKLLSIYLIK